MIKPPPIVHPASFSELSDASDWSSIFVLITPTPTTPNGWTIEIFGASMKLPMIVVTDDFWAGFTPAISPPEVIPAPKPTNEPRIPTDPPKFQFLSRQSVAVRHPALPAKL